MIRSRMSLPLMLILQATMLFSQKVPDWVDEMPVDDKYYWARENVGVRGSAEEEYKSKANNQALNTISMQIRTTVSGRSESSFTEKMTDSESTFEDDFKTESGTSTIADIQGAEKVGEYTSSTTYWVLWRLDKSVHEQNMEKYVDAARNQYEGFIQIPQDDPVGQLQYLIPAYEAVIKVAGVPASFNGKNLKTDIPNQISSVLNSIRLVPDGKTDLTGKVGFSIAKPLKVRVKGSKGMDISNIPILYAYETGEVEFSNPNVFTSSSGRASTKVERIMSNKTTQRIRAIIDLKEWREDRLSKLVSFEKRLDEISRSNSVIFNLDVARVTQEEVAVITVGDTSVYNERVFKRLNRSFRKQFNVITEYKLKDEALAEEAMEQYKRSSELCSSEECQIKIGKKLGIQRLIFIDVQEYPKEIAITIFLRNIIENELEMEYTYNFEKNKSDSREDKIKIIENNARAMVEDFWIRNNPGYLNVTINRRNIKANFIHRDATPWMLSSFEKRLPLYNEEFFDGDYVAQIDILGYEPFETNLECPMGEVVELEIDLIKKTPGKAFWKSLLIPGRGQIYSSDEDNRGRFALGLTYFFSTAALVGASGYLWSDYLDAKDVYDVSRVAYLNAVEIDEVSTNQSIMVSNHSSMSDKRSTAVLVTGLTVGMWIFNVVDAALFFPAEYKGKRLSMNVSPVIMASGPGANTRLTLSF